MLALMHQDPRLDTVNDLLLTKVQTASSMASPVEGCKYEVGNPAATPIAPPGELCVFTQIESAEGGKVLGIHASPTTLGDTPVGAFIYAEPYAYGSPEETGVFELSGEWAVTEAETAP